MKIEEDILMETWCHYFRGGMASYIKSAPGGHLYLTEKALYFVDGNVLKFAFSKIAKDFSIPLTSIAKVYKSMHLFWPTLRITTRDGQTHKFLLNPNSRVIAGYLPGFVVPSKTKKWIQAIKNRKACFGLSE